MEFATNTIDGKAKTITRNGNKYLVSPVVALAAGVVNGEYVTAEELSKFAASWNGRPVPLGHPQVNGDYISANSPEQWDTIPGFFWNATVSDDKLRGEIWLDIEKANQIGGDAMLAYNRMLAGQPVEVSTAYFRDLIDESGEHNGKPYTGIATNLRPDHLAILLHESGACSWTDGCGTPRVNSTDEQDKGSKSFISALVRSVIQTIRGNEMNREKTISTLVANAQCKCNKEQLEAMDDATLTAFAESIAPVVNEDVIPEPAPVAAELPDSISQFAAMLEQLGGAEKLASALGAVVTNAEREHGGLVAGLVANAQCTLDEAELKAMPVATLRKLTSTFAPKNYSGNAGAIVGNADEFYVMEMPKFESAGGK